MGTSDSGTFITRSVVSDLDDTLTNTVLYLLPSLITDMSDNSSHDPPQPTIGNTDTNEEAQQNVDLAILAQEHSVAFQELVSGVFRDDNHLTLGVTVVLTCLKEDEDPVVDVQDHIQLQSEASQPLRKHFTAWAFRHRGDPADFQELAEAVGAGLIALYRVPASRSKQALQGVRARLRGLRPSRIRESRQAPHGNDNSFSEPSLLPTTIEAQEEPSGDESYRQQSASFSNGDHTIMIVPSSAPSGTTPQSYTSPSLGLTRHRLDSVPSSYPMLMPWELK